MGDDKTIKSKKFKNTLDLFKSDLINLGYTLYDDLLCATDYGIPQTRTRYFLIAILNKNQDFIFPQKSKQKHVLKDFLDKEVEEKFYLTNSNYIQKDNVRIFKNKNKEDIEYEVDMDKYYNGGIFGKDKHAKFNIASRLFSIYGNSPTLTASNTVDNSKIVVEK